MWPAAEAIQIAQGLLQPDDQHYGYSEGAPWY